MATVHLRDERLKTLNDLVTTTFDCQNPEDLIGRKFKAELFERDLKGITSDDGFIDIDDDYEDKLNSCDSYRLAEVYGVIAAVDVRLGRQYVDDDVEVEESCYVYILPSANGSLRDKYFFALNSEGVFILNGSYDGLTHTSIIVKFKLLT